MMSSCSGSPVVSAWLRTPLLSSLVAGGHEVTRHAASDAAARRSGDSVPEFGNPGSAQPVEASVPAGHGQEERECRTVDLGACPMRPVGIGGDETETVNVLLARDGE